MKNRKLSYILPSLLIAVVAFSTGCKKGTFDINDVNPNAPSIVSPGFSLPAAQTATASLIYSGSGDVLNVWMGYWAVSGDYTASTTLVDYQLTTDFYTGNWESAYLNLGNYKLIEDESSVDSTLDYYAGIAKIMKAFVFQRVVDLYNNIPYSQALDKNNFVPGYDDGSAVYNSLINQVDSGIAIINAGVANDGIQQNPGNTDVMFGGDMDLWVKFANTLKLKLIMRLTQTSSGASLAAAELTGLTSDDFLGADEDAVVNPGYAGTADAKENPLYLNVAFNSSNADGTNHKYWRANSYAVDFYYNNDDSARAEKIYETKSDGLVHGRLFGAPGTPNDHNSSISAVNGDGYAYSPTQGAIILPASESFFLQAEAVQRGYLTGSSASELFDAGVTESFRSYNVDDYASAAADYLAQNNSVTSLDAATNKLQTIIVQKWASLNGLDPLETYSDWRRTGFPSNLPVSVDVNNTATHIPYRFLYPTSESNYNGTSVQAQGALDVFTSKIFWMP